MYSFACNVQDMNIGAYLESHPHCPHNPHWELIADFSNKRNKSICVHVLSVNTTTKKNSQLKVMSSTVCGDLATAGNRSLVRRVPCGVLREQPRDPNHYSNRDRLKIQQNARNTIRQPRNRPPTDRKAKSSREPQRLSLR